MENKKLIILHGWQSSKERWEKVKQALEKKGIDVLIPDLPGFKQETKIDKPWDLDDYLKWFENFSQDMDQFFLMGHSFGGRISLKFAAKYPQRIKGLILCDAAGIKPEPDIKIRAYLFLSQAGNGFFNLKPFKWLKEIARKVFHLFLRRSDYVKANPVMKETLKMVLHEDLLPLVSGIKAKTLIIWGKEDRMVPLKYAYLFKQLMKNTELILLPNVAHSPHLQVPQKLSEIIFKFLKKTN